MRVERVASRHKRSSFCLSTAKRFTFGDTPPRRSNDENTKMIDGATEEQPALAAWVELSDALMRGLVHALNNRVTAVSLLREPGTTPTAPSTQGRGS